MSRTPTLPLVAGGYIVGTIGGAILGGPWLLTALLGLLLLGTLILAAPANERVRPTTALVISIALAAGVASFAHWRIDHLDGRPPPPLAAMTGTHEVVGIARGDAVLDGSMQRVDIDVETVDGAPLEGGVRISSRVDVGVASVGDRLRLIVALDLPPAVEAFDYAAYLRDRDVHLVGSFPREWEHLGTTDRGWRGSLEEFHRTVVRRIEQTLPEPQASLAAGVLVGERATLPEDIDEALRATGTTHLVVVSGHNVQLCSTYEDSEPTNKEAAGDSIPSRHSDRSEGSNHHDRFYPGHHEAAGRAVRGSGQAMARIPARAPLHRPGQLR